jgi:hypothetical protein
MVKFFKNLFKRKPKFQISDRFAALIFEVATGNKAMIAPAILVHRAYLKEYGDKYKKTNEYFYMSEVDNVIPDYIFKADVRRKLLQKYGSNAQRNF